MSSLEQVLKAYEGPDQFFLHNINAHGRISRRGNSFSVRSLLSSRIGDGGAGRSRTDDILLAKQALYQLSYGPVQGLARRAVGDCNIHKCGRPGQTRTADLTLIRRTL